jgi:hypothetical protein
MPAPSGEIAISVVEPPPFFHGMTRYRSGEMTIMGARGYLAKFKTYA